MHVTFCDQSRLSDKPMACSEVEEGGQDRFVANEYVDALVTGPYVKIDDEI